MDSRKLQVPVILTLALILAPHLAAAQPCYDQDGCTSCVAARRWFGFGPTRCLQCSAGFTLTTAGTCDCAPGYGSNPLSASDASSDSMLSTFWPGAFFGFYGTPSSDTLCQACPDGTTSAGGAPRSTTCQPAAITPVTTATPTLGPSPPPYASTQAATAPSWPYSGDARDASSSGTAEAPPTAPDASSSTAEAPPTAPDASSSTAEAPPAASDVAVTSAPPPIPVTTTSSVGSAPTISGTAVTSSTSPPPTQDTPLPASPATPTAEPPSTTSPSDTPLESSTAAAAAAPTGPSGEVGFTKPGPFNWTAPEGVTSISVFCVGGGGAALGANAGGGGGAGSLWMNNIPVTPGAMYVGAVGAPGSVAARDGGDSSLVVDYITLAAQGGKGTNTSTPGDGGCYTSYVEDSLKERVASGGACGGAGGAGSAAGPGGGGGAGGYEPSSDVPPCTPGTGPGDTPKAGCVSDGGLPGGAVRSTSGVWQAFGGAGVGIKGPSAAAPAVAGQVFGGGAGGLRKGSRRGLGGACRIVFGEGRSYPSNAA